MESMTTTLNMESTDTIITIETNCDDTDGERLGFLMNQLFKGGALDVSYTPVQMKKNRPGVALNVMASAERLEPLIDLLFKHSGTLGMRLSPVSRIKCQREVVRTETKLGPVNIKIARWKGKIVNIKPEYDDCQEIALKHNMSIQAVRAIATRGFLASNFEQEVNHEK